MRNSNLDFLFGAETVLEKLLYPRDAVGKETTVQIDINGEKFVGHGLTVCQRNYLEVKIKIIQFCFCFPFNIWMKTHYLFID